MFGNDQALVDQVSAAAARTDERVWQLPLDRGYRGQLDSEIADLKNMGDDAMPARSPPALFLEEFVGDTPWAHLDIAGTAQSEGDRGWMTEGCTGFGARLLLQLALDFEGLRRMTAAAAASARRSPTPGCWTSSSGWATRCPTRCSCSCTSSSS